MDRWSIPLQFKRLLARYSVSSSFSMSSLPLLPERPPPVLLPPPVLPPPPE
jgi:hypothetical protein